MEGSEVPAWVTDYEGLCIGDLVIICAIDMGETGTNYGKIWHPHWAAECKCGVVEILDLEEVQTLKTYKCDHTKEI